MRLLCPARSPVEHRDGTVECEVAAGVCTALAHGWHQVSPQDVGPLVDEQDTGRAGARAGGLGSPRGPAPGLHLRAGLPDRPTRAQRG